ncbi:bifunctional diguanylate cyclase/phosphodiesterase [Rhodoferax sp. AJA081-3]|uniref:putative bifunctional diguanylate cyclase/phosphodiesterase n=1 Tax=Rhodoferax sp. AJA081-3 TaxID=2752316 RepID=UPI001ADF78BF|nr:bifunctional diguanylate cyclase/phosphodiesterase [Rhodoferax sp. AJA081-3]QTN29966.1 bifunctional diguanylate cyclase/phosphodiesterase [Rhodoferax sp. AJA081-3]
MNTWSALAAASLLIALAMAALYWRERRTRQRLTEERDELEKQLLTKGGGDALTGLMARGMFDAAMVKKAQEVDRGGGTFCVLYVALDNFVMLNDAFGSETGDRMLKEVARRLTLADGKKTRACYVSVGEFALFVDGDHRSARKSAQRVSDALTIPFTFDAIRAQLTCSIGVAVYPEHGAIGKLLGNAALAMRSVKFNGGSDFCLYDPKMGVEVREQALLFNDLRSALEKGEFELYFQPKIDAISLQVTGAEALLRWHHSERGLISPVVFIPLAEQYGLIGPIGGWVIEEACRKAARWREHGLRMRVAVNISGYQMREDDLVERITAALQRHGIQPDRFTCEITESVAMEDTKVTQQTFEKMRNAGFHVSIDDFGTGYSSLAALRKLPAAELKIDRAFVSDLEESEDARSIAQSIVNMATALNLRVVAEGVETPGQRDLLVAMGCNELQGFLFSLPMPAYELERLALDVDNKPDEMEFRKSLFSETYLGKLH